MAGTRTGVRVGNSAEEPAHGADHHQNDTDYRRERFGKQEQHQANEKTECGDATTGCRDD